MTPFSTHMHFCAPNSLFGQFTQSDTTADQQQGRTELEARSFLACMHAEEKGGGGGWVCVRVRVRACVCACALGGGIPEAKRRFASPFAGTFSGGSKAVSLSPDGGAAFPPSTPPCLPPPTSAVGCLLGPPLAAAPAAAAPGEGLRPCPTRRARSSASNWAKALEMALSASTTTALLSMCFTSFMLTNTCAKCWWLSLEPRELPSPLLRDLTSWFTMGRQVV